MRVCVCVFVCVCVCIRVCVCVCVWRVISGLFQNILQKIRPPKHKHILLNSHFVCARVTIQMDRKRDIILRGTHKVFIDTNTWLTWLWFNISYLHWNSMAVSLQLKANIVNDGYHFYFIFRRLRFQISGRKPATFTKAVDVFCTSPRTFRHSMICRAQSRPPTFSRIRYSVTIPHSLLYVQNEIKASYIHCSVSEVSISCHLVDFHDCRRSCVMMTVLPYVDQVPPVWWKRQWSSGTLSKLQGYRLTQFVFPNN